MMDHSRQQRLGISCSAFDWHGRKSIPFSNGVDESPGIGRRAQVVLCCGYKSRKKTLFEFRNKQIQEDGQSLPVGVRVRKD
jgi:hypothetical protein